MRPLDSGRRRRHAWVSYGVAGLWVLTFLLAQFTGHGRLARGLGQLRQALELHATHPYLHLDPRLRQALQPGSREADARRPAARPKDTRARFAALEQVELDGLAGGGFDTLHDTPQWRWGVVPARFSPLGVLTSAALPAGLLSLAFNLVFLILLGPDLERRWGSAPFAGFVLAAAVAGAAAFSLRFPALDAPLLGGCGLTAGLLGAALVLQGNRTLRPLSWTHSDRWGGLAIPVWGLLPLWLARLGLSPYLADVVSPGAAAAAGSWAVGGGFAFGLTTAAALRWGRRSAGKATLPRRPPVPSAPRRPVGDSLARRLREEQGHPVVPETSLELWDLAVELGRAREAAPTLLRLIQARADEGGVEDALAHWRTLRRHLPDGSVPAPLGARLAEALAGAGRTRDAAEVAAAAEVGPQTPASVLARLVPVAEGEDRDRLRSLALAHPELDADMRLQLEPSEAARWLRAEPPSTPEGRPSAREAPAGSPAAKVLPGVPLKLDCGGLTVALAEGRKATLRLELVKAVSAAAVEVPGSTSNLVMDLFLDAPSASRSPRCIRLESRQFDPRRLVPAEPEPEDAFLSLAGVVLAASGAPWLLGESPARLRRCPSVAAYEAALSAALRASPA